MSKGQTRAKNELEVVKPTYFRRKSLDCANSAKMPSPNSELKKSIRAKRKRFPSHEKSKIFNSPIINNQEEHKREGSRFEDRSVQQEMNSD